MNNEEISVLSNAIYAEVKPHSKKRFRLVAAGTSKYYRNRSIFDLKKTKKPIWNIIQHGGNEIIHFYTLICLRLFL